MPLTAAVVDALTVTRLVMNFIIGSSGQKLERCSVHDAFCLDFDVCDADIYQESLWLLFYSAELCGVTTASAGSFHKALSKPGQPAFQGNVSDSVRPGQASVGTSWKLISLTCSEVRQSAPINKTWTINKRPIPSSLHVPVPLSIWRPFFSFPAHVYFPPIICGLEPGDDILGKETLSESCHWLFLWIGFHSLSVGNLLSWKASECGMKYSSKTSPKTPVHSPASPWMWNRFFFRQILN